MMRKKKQHAVVRLEGARKVVGVAGGWGGGVMTVLANNLVT